MLVASVLFTSLFLYSRISLVKNISNSVASFYLADSGIEKVLYYDRKIIPEGGIRGICYMCAQTPSCPSGEGGEGPSDDGFLNCQCTSLVAGTANPLSGCDPTVCDDCQISFTTSYGNKEYSVNATVFPPLDPDDLKIQSFGLFDNIGRAIEVLVNIINKQP